MTGQANKGHGRKFLIVSLFFVLAALLTLLIGGKIAGWDIAAWFGTKYAVWLIVAIVFTSLAIIYLCWEEFERRRYGR